MLMSSKISKRIRRKKCRRFPLLSFKGDCKELGVATVCGVDYSVVIGRSLKIEDGWARGICHAYTNTVAIDGDLGKAQQEITLLHELIHAVDDVLSIDLSEEQVHALGAGLYSLRYQPAGRKPVKTMKGVFYGD